MEDPGGLYRPTPRGTMVISMVWLPAVCVFRRRPCRLPAGARRLRAHVIVFHFRRASADDNLVRREVATVPPSPAVHCRHALSCRLDEVQTSRARFAACYQVIVSP